MSQIPPSIPAPPSPPGSLPTNGKAITSLILGIIAIPGCCCPYGVVSIVCGALALIFGYMARKEIATGRYSPASNVLSLIGMICGGVGLLLGIIWWVLFAVGSSVNFQEWVRQQQQQQQSGGM